MQSTMIMSALANPIMQNAIKNSADSFKEGEMVETSADMLENIVGDKTTPQVYSVQKPRQQKREFKKIGRNDPCPCHSGKKYKHCCLNSGKYEGYVDA